MLVSDLIAANELLVKVLDDYERDCGEAGFIVSWRDWVRGGGMKITEQDCINARIALGKTTDHDLENL